MDFYSIELYHNYMCVSVGPFSVHITPYTLYVKCTIVIVCCKEPCLFPTHIDSSCVVDSDCATVCVYCPWHTKEKAIVFKLQLEHMH